MKNRLLLVVLVLSLGLNAGLLVQRFRALEGEPLPTAPGEVSCGWSNRVLSTHLGLNEMQTQRLEEGRRLMLQRLLPLRQALGEKRRQLMAVFSEPGPDGESMNRLIADIARLQGGIERVVIDHALAARKLFAPGQESRYHHLLEHILCPALREEAQGARSLCPVEEPCTKAPGRDASGPLTD